MPPLQDINEKDEDVAEPTSSSNFSLVDSPSKSGTFEKLDATESKSFT